MGDCVFHWPSAAFAEQADGLALGEQRRLDAERVRGIFRRGGFDFGEISGEQNFLERLGVKSVFEKSGVVPRVNDQQFLAVETGWNQNAVAAPVGGLRAVRVTQNIGIVQRLFARRAEKF